MSDRQRVLVVDDEAGIQMALEGVLELEGFDVRLASNGREALDVLTEWTPDAIVLDLMMPVMSGEAFREAQLRLPDGLDRIPVVVLSAKRNLEKTAQAMGAAAVIPKPFDLELVVATLRDVIQSHHQ